MKRQKIIRLVLVGLLIAVAAIAGDTFIFNTARAISGTLEIPVTGTSVRPYYLTSVLLSFPEPVTNEFTVSYVRNDVTNVLLNVPETNMTHVTWYIPGRVYFRDGDTLRFVNSTNGAATLTLNAEF